MHLDLLDIVRTALKKKLKKDGYSDEDAGKLASEGAEQVIEGFKNQSFEDIAERLREQYSTATEEDLARAITINEDGWSIDYNELPRTRRERLQGYVDGDIEAVEILATRVDGICDVCMDDCFEYYTVEEAMERQILPHDDCTCTGDAAAPGDSPCACCYAPAFIERVPEHRR